MKENKSEQDKEKGSSAKKKPILFSHPVMHKKRKGIVADQPKIK